MVDEQIRLANDALGNAFWSQNGHMDASESWSVPPLPESVWTGLIADYRRLVAPTTEAPDVYHYFLFMLGMGVTIGRKLSVYHASRLYPNFFLALVGPTGIARKDTAQGRMIPMVLELNHEVDADNPSFLYVPGIGSAEGLLDALGGSHKTVLVRTGELLSLMAKAKQDALSNLIPQLTELYDCPDHHSLRTRSRPIECRFTFLSLVAGTTPKWLHKSLTEREILGGFANRFIFAPGTPKAPIAYPPKPREALRTIVLKEMNDVRIWAQSLTTGELLPTDRAKGRFEDWYGDYYPRAAGDGLLPALSVRFQSFAWKIALLYAAMERSEVIDAHHIESGLSVVDWLWTSNGQVFSEMEGKGRDLEDTIMRRLTNAPGKQMPDRTLYRSLKISAEEFIRATEPMERLGLLRRVYIGKNGKKGMAGHAVNY